MDVLVPASVGTTQYHDEAMRLVARGAMTQTVVKHFPTRGL